MHRPAGYAQSNAIDAMENSIHPMMPMMQIAIEPSDARQRGRVLFFAPETPDTRAKRRLVLKPDDSRPDDAGRRRRGPRERSVATRICRTRIIPAWTRTPETLRHAGHQTTCPPNRPNLARRRAAVGGQFHVDCGSLLILSTRRAASASRWKRRRRRAESRVCLLMGTASYNLTPHRQQRTSVDAFGQHPPGRLLKTAARTRRKVRRDEFMRP